MRKRRPLIETADDLFCWILYGLISFGLGMLNYWVIFIW